MRILKPVLRTSSPGEIPPIRMELAAGWLAVGLTAIVSSVAVLFAAGAVGVTPEFASGSLLLAMMFCVLGPLAVAIPKAGAAYGVIGLLTLFLVEGFGTAVGMALIATGLLWLVGLPRPRRAAYCVTIGAPLATAALSIALRALRP